MALQVPFERPCAVDRVVSIVDDDLFCSVGHDKFDLFCFQTFLQILHQQVDDAADVLSGQWFIEYNLIQTVQEFRTEAVLQQSIDLFLCLVADLSVRSDTIEDIGGTKVGGQDDDGVLKVDGTSLRIGDSSIVQYLKQDVEHIRVCLFHLIEQNNRVRSAANRFGQLTALLIADISWRRSDQTGDGVFLHVFAHINTDHVVFIIKQGLGKGLGKLGLTDTGRSQEQEGTDWTVRVGDTCPRTQDCFADKADCLILSDDIFVQDVLHVQQLLALTLHDLGNRDAGPLADHLGNFFFGDLISQQAGLLCFFCQLFLFFQFCFELRQLAILEFGCFVEVVFSLCTFDLSADLFDFLTQLLYFGDGGLFVVPLRLHRVEFLSELRQFLGDCFQTFLGQLILLFLEGSLCNFLLDDLAVELIQLGRHRIHLGTDHRARFIDQVDCLIRQETVGDITVGQGCRCNQRSILNLDAVINLVTFLQTTQDRDGILHGRFCNQYRLKTTLQRSILFNIFAVLVQSGCTDTVQLTTGQHWF